MDKLKKYIKDQNVKVHAALEKYTSFDPGPFSLLAESIRYSLFAGGKRVRPVLCLAAADICGGSEGAAMPFGCALEMIHTYSLIHDDLPAMDNDDSRRGKPTNHKIYGDAQALLAGNSLLTLAYEISLDAAATGLVTHKQAVDILLDISRAIGIIGVMGGQSLDMQNEGKDLTIAEVEQVCHYKTATLIMTAVRSGALAANATAQQLDALTRYGKAIGLAFQVADDILNEVGDPEKLGKAVNSDVARGKTTFATLLGVDKAREMANGLKDDALDALSIFGNEAWMLRDLAVYIVTRDH